MAEQKPKTWDETVSEVKQYVEGVCARSKNARSFFEQLKTKTAEYLEMQGAVDPQFSTDFSFMDLKMQMAWLVSAECPELIELQLEWRITFCATCHELDTLQPFHVDLVKA